jgi:hypothetical protein
MVGRRRRMQALMDRSSSDECRITIFMQKTDEGWSNDSAALVSLASIPFDDAVEPQSREWEDETRARSFEFGAAMMRASDEETVTQLARQTLEAYRASAIAAGEPHYSTRWDQNLGY